MLAHIIILFLIYFFIKSSQRPLSYPPGPPFLPIIGNLVLVWYHLRFFKHKHVLWKQWSKKYGNLLGLRLGFINIVIVFGKDLIKEVSTREVFDGRPNGFLYLIRSFGKKLGLVFSDGPAWNRTRRTVLKCLKHFGYSSSSMENNISDECRALIDVLLDDAGKPIKVNHMFNVAIVNILWKLVAGKRYDLKDKRLKTLCNLINKAFRIADMSGGILNFLPFLRHVIPGFTGYNNLKSVYKELHVFLEDIIEEHKQSIDIRIPRDVIDVFLIEMIEKKDNNFTEEELKVICLDLLEAGVETVNNTAVFLLLYIIRNPDIQKRLQMEIDTEIGFSRRPMLTDRSRMVYTEAVLLEALRMSSVAAVGIPHMALEDTRLGNSIIPKGTFILLSIHDLHNGEHWNDSTVFRPERFITKEGNLKQDEWLMAFGIGRRRCIGEGFARSELFMFLTHILQRFNLKIPDGDTLPLTDPIDGITLAAQDFSVVFEPRF